MSGRVLLWGKVWCDPSDYSSIWRAFVLGFVQLSGLNAKQIKTEALQFCAQAILWESDIRILAVKNISWQAFFQTYEAFYWDLLIGNVLSDFHWVTVVMRVCECVFSAPAPVLVCAFAVKLVSGEHSEDALLWAEVLPLDAWVRLQVICQH